MTNRQAHEEAAGYGLSNEFFFLCGIDPDAEYIPIKEERKDGGLQG